MNTKAIIQKLCEITIHVGAFDSDVYDIDSVISQMRSVTGCSECKKLAKELSLLQEKGGEK